MLSINKQYFCMKSIKILNTPNFKSVSWLRGCLNFIFTNSPKNPSFWNFDRSFFFARAATQTRGMFGPHWRRKLAQSIFVLGQSHAQLRQHKPCMEGMGISRAHARARHSSLSSHVGSVIGQINFRRLFYYKNQP